MANLLYLVHRMPYPPNKGDKVRSYHLLRHLQKQHRVFLGTFIDDPADEEHLPALKAMCPDLHVARLHPLLARLRSLGGLIQQGPLTLAYYRNAALREWVRQTAARHGVSASVVFSSAMVPYAMPLVPRVPMLVDFVDVDSAKWSQYAEQRHWPMSWVYAREARELLAYERMAAQRAQRSFFVTQQETDLFLRLAPEAQGRVEAVGNGVDADFFRPQPETARPFAPGETAVVFTGAMDYWPNVDAVSWFVAEMLPALRQRHPGLRFYIVGRSPTPAVQALAGEGVVVTGTVPDVRPYLQHASAVVAPLRVARGIQNKILEAMAMGRPVVTVPACAEVIGASADDGLLRAGDPADTVAAVDQLLADPQAAALRGERARQFVLDHFSWQAQLAAMDASLNAVLQPEKLHA
jgi:sugar transferase (PEP-CTERM/EpsH1 system associated)